MRIEAGVVVRDCTIGPNVTLEAGASVVGSTVRDSIVGAGASIESSQLQGSLVGAGASVRGFGGRLSVMDHAEVASG
ncbi:MAG: hypothetical protein GWN07_21080 [Actinobacteria bacterium]|nr:hypothetical protein [Actinomycetota bacterium]